MLALESYLAQSSRWPETGRHILAQFDRSSIIVYQAYRPEIGMWAIQNGKLGGPAFSFNRMSWIKPNFLWMMYRSGWGTKQGQEVVLALRIRRSFFDELLAQSVPSSFTPGQFRSQEDWRKAIDHSEVRLQWDPDHDPSGVPLRRRAIQLGLRGMSLARLAGPDLLEVLDMSRLVALQRSIASSEDWARLEIPREDIYVPLPPAAVGVSGE
jgi:hypothetical protein